MNKAIFLDRDGVINVDKGYTYQIKDLVLLEGIKESLKYLKKLGYILIIITNQSGIGRGYYTQKDCEEFNNTLQIKVGGLIDDIYICPHIEKDDCECRKPKIGNIIEAKKKFGINMDKSYFIGDKESDILCGKNAGCKTIYIKNQQYKTTVEPDFIINSMNEIKNIIT